MRRFSSKRPCARGGPKVGTSFRLLPVTCPRRLYHPLCQSGKHVDRVGRQKGLRRRRPVAQRTVRSDPVINSPVPLRQHTRDDVKDSEASLRRLSQYPGCPASGLFRRLFSNSRRFQPSGLIDPETPAVAAPAVEGLLGHADPTGGLSDCAAPGYRHLGLSELSDYLLRRMSLPGHLSPFYGPILTSYLDQFSGSRSIAPAL